MTSTVLTDVLKAQTTNGSLTISGNGSGIVDIETGFKISGTAGVPTADIRADAITGAKIADDAIDSEHYAAGSIDSAHLADDVVTLAKMAPGTDGVIISYDASGNPVHIGPGTDGEVLTSTGAGSPPAFEAAASGGATSQEAVNIMLNAFRISVNGGLTVQNMVDGVVDEFEDQTGVDTSTSTNETYDSTNDYYNNPSSSDQVAQGDGYNIGNMTYNGGLAAAFDGNTSQASSSCAYGGASITTGYVGKDWGSGTTRRINQVKVWGSSNYGYEEAGSGVSAHTITIFVQGSTDNFSSSVVDLGGNISFNDSGGSNTKTLTMTSTTSYRYHRIRMQSNGGSGVYLVLAEVQFHEYSPVANMTLFSNATTALAVPSDANIVIWQQDVDSVTLNTDLKAYASRNSGTTYTQMTLSEVASLTTGRILTGTVDISGQSSATAMKYKIQVLNTKEQKIHGVALQWS